MAANIVRNFAGYAKDVALGWLIIKLVFVAALATDAAYSGPAVPFGIYDLYFLAGAAFVAAWGHWPHTEIDG